MFIILLKSTCLNLTYGFIGHNYSVAMLNNLTLSGIIIPSLKTIEQSQHA